MEFGQIIGWIGLGFGMLVPIPQIIKIIKTKRTKHVSILTYVFLIICMSCYLLHAIHIKATVFIWAQSINLTINSTLLILLLTDRRKINIIKQKPQWLASRVAKIEFPNDDPLHEFKKGG